MKAFHFYPTARPCYSLLLLLLFSALLALPSGVAQAQTPITQIENAAGDTVLTVFDDGGLLGRGKFVVNSTNIPAEGAGTRLMWFPGKAAFRAGKVGVSGNGDHAWDADSVGDYSMAFGVNTKASGGSSTAMGYSTTANGFGSTAMGYFTTAETRSSTAMGYSTTTNGFGSTAMGFFASASGYASTAMGDNATASGDASTAMGSGTTAEGTSSTAMGSGTTAEGTSSTAMGYSSTASGDYSTAMGYSTTASGYNTTAMGVGTTASGDASTAMGSGTTAEGTSSTAMGDGATASGDYSTAMGYTTTAATNNSLSIGKYNSANTTADNTLFVVGNGVYNSPSDALVLDNSGNLTIAGSLTESSDRRLKTNIAPLQDGVLGKLATIIPSTFEFKNQQTHPAGPQIGLIAQQVQQPFPELVSTAGNGYLSVSYSKFTAVLLKGLQEQQEQINALKKENKSMDQRLTVLEQQNRQTAGLSWPATAGLLTLLLGGGLLLKANTSTQKG